MLPVQEQPERMIVTLLEMHALAAAMPRPTDRVYTYLMGLGGARIGEPAALRVKDFDGSSITIREAVKGSRSARLGSTKTNKVRRVPLPPWPCEEIAVLAKGRLPEAWLLPSRLGQMISPDNWRGHVFDPAAKRAGVTPAQWERVVPVED
jgi:integrase